MIIKADSKYPVDRRRIRKTVSDFLEEQKIEGEVEVNVSVVGDRKMRELNKKYMGVEGTTDVLSFPLSDDETGGGFVEPGGEVLSLGDIVVSWPVAINQALERKTTVDDEVDFLVKHGILHLLGIHHD